MARELKFRPLKADEVETRVAMVKDNGVMLLLYKNARVDMLLLDEVVGPLNWTRSHELIDGHLFCKVGVRLDESSDFVYKSDVGVESNTEATKGEASDSFKRACSNWGIGRELYSAPFIWISAKDAGVSNGKCYTQFSVADMKVVKGKITALSIRNEKTKKIVYTFGTPSTKAKAEPEQKKETKAEKPKAEVSKKTGEQVLPEAVRKMHLCIKAELDRTGLTLESIKYSGSLESIDAQNGAKIYTYLKSQPSK
ncbi:hypothetical protein [Eubacterium oxidoreducens]|uniref:Rad52/22 family double-strand break repair protein n=1 Tax=Eubacterium oxidoreducens TaxID=1732 RepID=A0A1G6C3Y1_EUBOX|nr:hypothetical protein [Eubacterium oxidoreducens]SDB27534.1 hypothetical protein SAMN02910417_02040 [Eubacterium oxidoreducens]